MWNNKIIWEGFLHWNFQSTRNQTYSHCTIYHIFAPIRAIRVDVFQLLFFESRTYYDVIFFARTEANFYKRTLSRQQTSKTAIEVKWPFVTGWIELLARSCYNITFVRIAPKLKRVNFFLSNLRCFFSWKGVFLSPRTHVIKSYLRKIVPYPSQRSRQILGIFWPTMLTVNSPSTQVNKSIK